MKYTVESSTMRTHFNTLAEAQEYYENGAHTPGELSLYVASSGAIIRREYIDEYVDECEE